MIVRHATIVAARALEKSAGLSRIVLSFLVFASAGPTFAAEKVVRNILTASAEPGAKDARTLVLKARVRLDNSCLSHPRFVNLKSRFQVDSAGVLSVAVVAHSSEGNGAMCAMHATDVDLPPLVLKKSTLAGVRSIRVTGSFHSALVMAETPPN